MCELNLSVCQQTAEGKRHREKLYRKTNPRRSQVSSACHDFLCAVLAHSLCEAKRPSDLKVSPFDTSRPPDVCCWRRPSGRKTDRERERAERGRRERNGNTARKTVRETWRETISEIFWHRCSKTAVKNRGRVRGGAKTVRTFGKLVKREGTWQRELRKHSGGGGGCFERWI